MSVKNWWNDISETEVFVGKPVPLPLCGPKIPHGLAWDGTCPLR